MNDNYLLFVYNADSNLFSAVTEFVHKIVAPSTYKCSLCSLTYGNISVKKEWTLFLEGVKIEKEFLHKDEFLKKYKMEIVCPVILYVNNGKFETMINAAELDQISTLDKLIELMKERLARLKIQMQ